MEELVFLNSSIDEIMPLLIIGGAVLLALLFYSINLSEKLKKSESERKKIQKENRALANENISLEAEKLKFRLHPHALKNMIAKLLVVSKNLNKGMETLAGTMNYIIYKGDNHFVSIQDEIQFIENYIRLNDLLSTSIDSIKFTWDVNENSKYFGEPCIPHLITGYFIENAFIHGDFNNPEFLKIHLKLSKSIFEFTVVNKLKKQVEIRESGGVGLINMRRRLELLKPGKFEIKNSCNEDEYHSALIIDLSNDKT